MKISVVIPLYNKENSILGAINSVLNQTEQDFELIVVDDGSTDRSATLVSNLLANRIIRLIQQENTGVSAARNRGVKEAQSDLVAFLDADDQWLPRFLETILELRSQFPEASVFGSLYYFQDVTGDLRPPKTVHLFEANYRGIIADYLNTIRIGLPFNSSSFAVSKKVFCELGGFSVGIKYGEDVDFWIRLSLRYKIAYANIPLAIYHQDAENRACDLYYPNITEYYPVSSLVVMMTDMQVPAHLLQSAIEYIAKYQLAFTNSYLYDGKTMQARKLLHTFTGTRVYFWRWLFSYICTFVPPVILRLGIKIRNHVRHGLS